MLSVVAIAEFNSGDLGDGIGFIGWLKRSGQRGVFGHGLRRIARIDAGRSQKQQPINASLKGAIDQTGLNHKVFEYEVSWEDVVRLDAADRRHGDHHGIGLRPHVERAHISLGRRIKLCAGPRNRIDALRL